MALHRVWMLLLLGCAPKLVAKPFDAGQPKPIEMSDAGDAGEPLDAGVFTTQRAIDGGTLVVVNATSSDGWIYFDLDRAAEVEIEATGWDIAFQRFSVKVNGGISGNAGVEVARVDAGVLADVTEEPMGTWMVDLPDGDDEGTSDDLAYLQDPAWYAYDSKYHSLTPRHFVYVVRSTEAALFKTRITSYYDENGTSGVMSFEWSPLSAH